MGKVPEYRTLAWIASDETILPGSAFHNQALEFRVIYNECPPQCRYAVVLNEGDRVRVIDVYGSDISQSFNPWRLTPKFVNREFANYEHACATMRVLYELDRAKEMSRHIMKISDKMVADGRKLMEYAILNGVAISNPSGGCLNFSVKPSKRRNQTNDWHPAKAVSK